MPPQHIEPPTAHHAAVPFYVNRLPMMPRSTPFPQRGISLADILGHNGSRWSVVIAANYMIDFPWLLRAAPALLTVERLILLSGEKSHEHILSHAASEGMRRAPIVVSPPLPIPYGTHHTKCLICLGERGVRVAVFTANFICDDWERKNQGIYVQDFPRRGYQNGGAVGGAAMPPPPGGDGGAGEEFSRTLADYLTKSGVNATVVQQLTSEYDFSFPAVELIPSVPGIHKTQSEMAKYGFVRLQSQLEKLDAQQHQQQRLMTMAGGGGGGAAAAPPPHQSLNLSWQYSSQGSLTLPFLKDLTIAMLGGPTIRGNRELADRVRIDVHFPTESQVRKSVEGWRGGSSIPVPVKNCHEFVNCRLHRWGHHRNTIATGRVDNDHDDDGLGTHPRNHAMPHIKSYSRFHRVMGSGSGTLDWFLLTSSNLSRAAWGEYQKGGAQVQIRSYELGVLFHPFRLAQWWAHNQSRNGGVFCCTRVPLGGHAVSHHDGDGGDCQQSSLIDTTGGLKLHNFRRVSNSASTTPTFSIALPYNIFNPEPYASTTQLQTTAAGGGAVVSSKDIPWVIDVPHRGHDCLGSTIEEALGEYSHYGPASWNASTKHFENWKPSSYSSLLTTSNVTPTERRSRAFNQYQETPHSSSGTAANTISSSNRGSSNSSSATRVLVEVIDVDAEDDDDDNSNSVTMVTPTEMNGALLSDASNNTRKRFREVM
ncbi:tyrosyl-DNA phosphatase (tyr1), putative [Bodo saltans]|uniref:Tyrosyl-DNA phosphatase (Tyr1), putative n=1 Tax=Bodo saltans TaxID=75058 RepID=A0A0S4JE96_BODSA|nr:tyrosyl-DNA phosphatase (tyr1), putative [Bodo saltans]|eukprot:CUG89697.1 tyrosyl-DNA phosphatase (tyr1), putative [Bodo saltans]